MTPTRWQHIKELLQETLEKEPAERESFLKQACNGDELLFAEVISLIPFYEQAGSFLEEPAAVEARTLRFSEDPLITKQNNSAQTILSIGSILQQRYEITRKIGQGGMGAVYEARDLRLGITVALKETIIRDTQMRKAFEREAHLLAKLRHSMLPVVSDHFFEGDGQFLIMQFIPGEDLSELLQRNGGPLETDQVLRWSEQLLDVLEFLHSHNPPIIHRDIKPNNLKLTQRGEIILLDFGLAKGATKLQAITTESSLLGFTPHYAPLEQTQSTGTEPRSDLYSLAATLYHLLTGEKPPDARQRALKILNDQEDPLLSADRINPRVPAAIAALLHSTMSLNANNRPADAVEMRIALRNAQSMTQAETRAFLTKSNSGELVVPDKPAPPRYHRALLIAAVTIVMTSGLFFARDYLPIAKLFSWQRATATPSEKPKPKQIGDPGFEGEPISLDVQGVPLNDVLRFLSDNYGFNFIVDDTTRDIMVTVKAHDVPWATMLDNLCSFYHLTYKREGLLITIAPKDRIPGEVRSQQSIKEAAARAAQEKEQQKEKDRIKLHKK